MKIPFFSKYPFAILSLQSKVMNKVQRRVGINIFFFIFKHPLWILSITFDWRLEIANEFLEMKCIFILQLFLFQRLKKNITMPSQDLKSADLINQMEKTNKNQINKNFNHTCTYKSLHGAMVKVFPHQSKDARIESIWHPLLEGLRWRPT